MSFFFFFLVWWGLGLEVVRMGVETGEPTLMTIRRMWFIFFFSWSLSHVRLFETPWTITCQSPLSMGFSMQEYLSGLPFPSPRDLSDPGFEPGSTELAGGFFTNWATREAPWFVCILTDLVRSPQRNRKLNDHLHKLLFLWLNFWISTLHSKFIVS